MAVVVEIAIAPAKLTKYLLNPEHPEGGSKAKFFLARGFSLGDPLELAAALALQAQQGWPGDIVSTDEAVKHRIIGPITCPDGSTPDILTVWQAADGNDTALLVTARPNRRKGE